MNKLVFGTFAALAIGRLVTAAAPLAPRTLGHTAGLLVICALGYHLATRLRSSRVWGTVAFLVGWFWMPGPALAALAGLAWLRRRPLTPPPSRDRKVAEGDAVEARSTDARSLLRTTLALKVAGEAGSRLKRAAAPFRSDYGEGTIPVLVQTEDGERAIYVEVPPWTEAAQNECLKWLALLRTSERENLEVEIHSEAPVPDLLSFYAKRSLRNSFELEGLLAVRWRTPEFARYNVSTLKRLAEKYLGTIVADGVDGLRTLDELVLGYFARDGHLLPSTVILVGSLVGEHLISAHGGEWIVGGEELEAVVVALPTPHGNADVNVFGKVLKLFSTGAEDSLAAMAVAIDDVLRG